jgi:lysophospholipase L1-like esterase
MRGIRPVVGFCSLFFVLAGGWQPAGNSAVRPVPRPDPGWKKRHESLVERARKGGVDVLFAGDSITQGWADAGKKVWDERIAKWNPANFGISGDKTGHVLWRLTAGRELVGIDPKVVVLLIGTNNFDANSSAEVAEGVAKIVQVIRTAKPASKVLLLDIFPRSARPAARLKEANSIPAAELHPKVKEVNGRIARLADGKSVRFLDIGGKFLNESGGLSREIMPDFLHLSPDGYRLWADAITPAVEEMLKN